MVILTTGANGLLGQKLTTLMQDDPAVKLVATARRSPLVKDSATAAVLDVGDAAQVRFVIKKHRPDVVIHTAAMTQVDQCETERAACWHANVESVQHVATACRESGAHLVHLSTDFIFDGTEGPLDESAIPNPISYYGQSKLAAEELIQHENISWSIIRTVLVYGVTPNQSRSNIVIWVRKSLTEGKTIQVVDDQWRTPTLAEDLAQGCLLAAKKKAQGIFHVSGDEMMTPFTLAHRTAKFFGLNEQLIQRTDSATFKQPAARPPRTGFVIAKARRELGYEPHAFEEGLAVIKAQWPVVQ